MSGSTDGRLHVENTPACSCFVPVDGPCDLHGWNPPMQVPDEDGFSVALTSGMRVCGPEERKRMEFDRETRERLLAFMDDADRCRARAEAESRFFVIGGSDA